VFATPIPVPPEGGSHPHPGITFSITIKISGLESKHLENIVLYRLIKSDTDVSKQLSETARI